MAIAPHVLTELLQPGSQVPSFYISDIHLRLDRPDRSDRLARFVDSLTPEDSLTIGGDLCDFWFASRESDAASWQCAGLRALIAFRDRGGDLAIIVGNHDAWLGPFYRQRVGARVLREPVEQVVSGIRVHLTHGHLIQGCWSWKRVLESRVFFSFFTALPISLARVLDRLLESANQRRRDASHQRLEAIYRQYVLARRENADLFLFGHVHDTTDESVGGTRLIVLGDWTQGFSYLRIDDEGASFIVRQGCADKKQRHDSP